MTENYSVLNVIYDPELEVGDFCLKRGNRIHDEDIALDTNIKSVPNQGILE